MTTQAELRQMAMDYYGLTYAQAVEMIMEMHYHGVNDTEALERVRIWTERQEHDRVKT